MSASAVRVRAALHAFDGKDFDGLRAIHDEGPASEEVLETLLDVFDERPAWVAAAATWLLRRYVEDGVEIREEMCARLVERLPLLPDGFARLHVCQTTQHLTIPEASAPGLADFFRECAVSPNTYLRAWAPDAFAHLALQHEAFADEAGRRVTEALNDPSASVRARARNTLRET